MRIAVALSGGIDSAIAAYLLKEEGHQVWGITMVHCPTMEASMHRVKEIAGRLHIPLITINMKEAFYREVIIPFAEGYARGETPNPCPLCNQRMKLGLLMEKALREGAEKMATGHYAKVMEKENSYHLMKGTEEDQSYLLALLNEDQLCHLILPLGDLTRKKVKELAHHLGILKKGDRGSQEICFVDGHYTQLLKTLGISPGPGPIKDEKGETKGMHKGYIHYTVGQRRGLGISSRRPLYVTRILPEENTIIVGPREALLSKRLTVNAPHWIHRPRGKGPWRVAVKIRYRHKESPAWIKEEGGCLTVLFDTPQKAPTPGQLAVFYMDNEVIGGGWIRKVR